MFSKTILGATTAAFIAAGALGASTVPAAASHMQPGFSFSLQFGNPGPYHYDRFCKPRYKKVKWYDKWGHVHFKVVYVGQRCRPVYRPLYPAPGFYYWGPGWGPGYW